MLKEDHMVVATDVNQRNIIRAVTWWTVHEHIVADAFRVKKSSSARLVHEQHSKHHKSDAFQQFNVQLQKVAIQLIVVTASEIHMIS